MFSIHFTIDPDRPVNDAINYQSLWMTIALIAYHVLFVYHCKVKAA